MTYTAAKTNVVYDPEELRRRIPGWGVDADPKDRPSYPKDRMDIETGARWEFPERQEQTYKREMTPEHKWMTPVFGTAQPPKGLSGIIRRLAYRYSEGRYVHWLMLVAADRIDVVENRVSALAHGKPDRAFQEMGLSTELKYGIESRRGQHRNDLKHQSFDAAMLASRYAVLFGAAYFVARAASGHRKRR
ncbi:MAG TPA: hypothetical protein VM100_04375 [Longimicrobiales bacterium]|nr:hypothetical protein [Longimicrobiales bacterium]